VEHNRSRLPQISEGRDEIAAHHRTAIILLAQVRKPKGKKPKR